MNFSWFGGVMKGYWLPLLLLLISVRCLSQTDEIRFYDQSKGLTQHSVSAISQDKKGFLWIGTRHGLNRYDGRQFKNFDQQGSSNSIIQSILVDRSGDIWVGTSGDGLTFYDYLTDTFKEYKSSDSSGSLSDNFVQSVFEDSRGNIWIGTETGGLNMLDVSSQTFKCYRSNSNDPFSLSSNNITAINEDNNGNLWVGTWGNGLNLFDQNTKRFIRYFTQSQNSSNHDDIVRCMYKDKKGNIFVGTHNGLKKLHYTNSTYSFSDYLEIDKIIRIDPTLSQVRVLSIAEDKLGNLWVGTENQGLFYLDIKTGNAKQYLRDFKSKRGLPSNSIWSLFVDDFGTVWIGSYDKGLFKIDPYEEKFTMLYESNPYVSSLSHNVVSSFAQDRSGNFWIGTDGGGLNYFNPETNELNHFKNDPNDPTSLGDNAVVSLALDEDDNLWVGTWEGGISILEKGSNKFRRITSNSGAQNKLSGNDIHKVYKDSKNRMWIGAFRAGLDMYDPKTNSFYHYFSSENTKENNENKIRTILEDFKGRIWIGTEGSGLRCITLNPDNSVKQVQQFVNIKGDTTSLSSNLITHLFEDSNKALWIGTEGGGLNKFNFSNNHFEILNKRDGLPSDVIYGIEEDYNGDLWISTNQGLVQYEVERNEFHVYDELDGLQSEEFYKASCFRARDGQLLFGGLKGFNIFNPNNVKRNPNAPPIYITGMSLSGESLIPGKDQPLTKNIIETDEIIFDYDQNDFSFIFSSLNYSQSEKNKFEYKLENYDDKWQQADERNDASYTNVPPGYYVFKVRGSNNDKVWNRTPRELVIIINKPWYKTYWAYFLYTGIIFLVLFISRDSIIKRERLKSELQLEHLELNKTQELSKLKSRFFANISHEFRTPLTLIIGPLIGLYQNMNKGQERNKVRMMIRNAEQLLSLINQVQDLSKLESGSMKLRATKNDIVKFLRSISYSFTSFADKKYITYKTDFPKKEIEVYFEREKLEKVFNNLLINAFKFTPDFGTITIGLKEEKQVVHIYVEDSGPGIPADEIGQIFNRFFQGNTSKAGTGIGLSLAKELVELHKGKISVASELGKITTFTITLQLGSHHLSPNEIGTENPSSSNLLTQAPLLENEELEDENSDESESFNKEYSILLVDDNEEMLNFVSETLSANYNITKASNGLEGLKIARTQIPDLIVTDVMMPEMDGYEFCEALKNDQKTSHIPVIMLTAKASASSELKGFNMGAIHYMTKPFNPSLLEVRVKNILQAQFQLKERILNNETLNLDPKHVVISSTDEDFLKKIVSCIELHMADSKFQVEDLCLELGLGRMQLYRKLKGLIGQSANEFIRSIKLKRAAQLIQQQKLTIAEITYMVGFNDLHYFRQCFKKQFGVNPSEYAIQEGGLEGDKKNS